MASESNDWISWSRYVLKTLEDILETQKELRKDIHDLKTNQALLKFKITLLGLGSGAGGFALSKGIEKLLGG